VVLVLSNGAHDCFPLLALMNTFLDCVPNDTGRAARDRAIQDDAMLYFVGLRPPGLSGAIATLAEETGGGHIEPARDADLAATFEQVADELHHQYAIGFRPAALDGTIHRLDVHVTRRDLTARARKSYLAAAHP
jgi:hypothetical protein